MAVEVTQNLTQVTISTAGVAGANGTSGTSGVSGTSGTSAEGTSGTSGINGTSGVDGSSGESGTNGIDGTSGTSGFSIDSGSFLTTSSFNSFTSSYLTDSASFDSRISAATNEQDLSAYLFASIFNNLSGSFATTGSNIFVGNQTINGSVILDNGSVIKDNVNQSISFGVDAAESGQGIQSTAIGSNSGQTDQGNGATAIGALAGNLEQGQSAIAIGALAGTTQQGDWAIAIGTQAGGISQGNYSIALGNLAGGLNQAANSVVINATGTQLDNTTASSLKIAPIRINDDGSKNVLVYNTTTKEVSYSVDKFATTGSNTFIGNQIITGSVTVTNSITSSVVSSSYIKFDSLPNGNAPSYQEGLLYYDNDMGSLVFYNNEADISLQIGQESYVRAINKSGGDILNGTPVRVSGSQGDRVKIYKAEAFIHTGSYNSSEAENHILGLATHDILNDETGYVTISGLVKGINTAIYEAGDVLYIQTGSAGVLTNVAPPFPYDKIQVGIVGRKHASVGEVLVLPKEPVHFGNITGLSGSSTTEVGDLWVYKSNNAWATSKTLEGDYTITGSLNIEGSGSLNGDNIVASTTIQKIETISSASYAALTPPVSGTLYIII